MTKLLLVEDESSYRDALVRLLAREGFEVRLAESGGTGVEIGETYRPDVLITDWILSDINGIEVAAALRELDSTLPVIFITGFRCEELSEKARERGLGNHRCLEKPFAIEELLGAIAEVLGDPSGSV